MSDAFYNLLDSANQYRCRKVDQLLLYSEDNPISEIADKQDRIDSGEKMNLVSSDVVAYCFAIFNMFTFNVVHFSSVYI